MIVWGGYYRSGSYSYDLSSGGRYRPETGTWQSVTTSSGPSARRGHTAVWMGDAMIIWGGGNRSGIYFKDTYALYSGKVLYYYQKM